jgi:hypothetical protein
VTITEPVEAILCEDTVNDAVGVITGVIELTVNEVPLPQTLIGVTVMVPMVMPGVMVVEGVVVVPLPLQPVPVTAHV